MQVYNSVAQISTVCWRNVTEFSAVFTFLYNHSKLGFDEYASFQYVVSSCLQSLLERSKQDGKCTKLYQTESKEIQHMSFSQTGYT